MYMCMYTTASPLPGCEKNNEISFSSHIKDNINSQ